MELEPISSPTNCLLLFPPNNDIWQPLYSFALLLQLTSPCLHLAHLALHPTVQDGLSEFPTVTEFERRNFAFRDVTVQGIRAYPQILRRLPHVHHFTRFIHKERRSSDTSHAREICVRRNSSTCTVSYRECVPCQRYPIPKVYGS